MSEIKQGYKQTKVGIIPEDWEIVKLGKLTTVETGKTPLRSNKQFWDNGTINWATTTEVNETYIVSTNEKITNQAVAELKMKILPINTILLAMYGQGKTRGKVALLRIESTINQAFASIKPNKNYSTNFIFNYLDKSYEKIRDLSHGSNQDNLNLDIVKALQIPLPPLKEQEKIAEILTTWDEAITKQTELLEAKELQKKALMQKLLSGEVRFNGFSYEWEEVRLSKIIKLQGGYAFKSEEFKKNGIPIIRISNISNNSNYMEMDDLVYYEELPNESNFLIKKNDLLIAMSGATTGKVSIYNLEKKAYLNQRVGLFKAIKPSLINYSFLTQFIFSNFFSVQLTSLLVAGAQPNISSKDIESLKVIQIFAFYFLANNFFHVQNVFFQAVQNTFAQKICDTIRMILVL